MTPSNQDPILLPADIPNFTALLQELAQELARLEREIDANK